MTFFNTTQESEQLAFDFTEVNKAKNKDILYIFESNPLKSFTPYEIGDILTAKGIKMLPSSVKRAITTLTDLGELKNTYIKVIERYGRQIINGNLNP